MFNNKTTYDRWGNPTSQEPPPETIPPPTGTWLGQGNTGQPPILHPPLYGPSRSDYPPAPSFPIQLPQPSPPPRPPGSTFGFSASLRFAPPGGGNPSLPPSLSPISRTNNPSDPRNNLPTPVITRPICNTCLVNCINVRESNTNFCERCFQDALRLRNKMDSPKAHRPTCRICHVNRINVREADMIYCERCWLETLKKRSLGQDGIPRP